MKTIESDEMTWEELAEKHTLYNDLNKPINEMKTQLTEHLERAKKNNCFFEADICNETLRLLNYIQSQQRKGFWKLDKKINKKT